MRKGIKVFVIIGLLIFATIEFSNMSLARTLISDNDDFKTSIIQNGNIDDNWGGPGTNPPENISNDPWEYFVLLLGCVIVLGSFTAKNDKKYEGNKVLLSTRWIYRFSFSLLFVAVWSITIDKDASIGLLFSTPAIILPFIERKNKGEKIWHYYISFAFLAIGWLTLLNNSHFDFTALFILLAIMILFGGFYLKDHSLVDYE